MISEQLRLAILEVFSETERLDKVTVSADPVSSTVTIVYEDIDDEWFRDLGGES